MFPTFDKNGVLGGFSRKPNFKRNEFSSWYIWQLPHLPGQTAHSTILQTCQLPRTAVKGGWFCDNGDVLVHVPSIPYARRSTIRLAFLRTSILDSIQCGALVFPMIWHFHTLGASMFLQRSRLQQQHCPSDPFPMPGHTEWKRVLVDWRALVHPVAPRCTYSAIAVILGCVHPDTEWRIPYLAA